ncbi:MAG: hypothetical protein CR971_00610, partial [candidate division SR1 bacterium]
QSNRATEQQSNRATEQQSNREETSINILKLMGINIEEFLPHNIPKKYIQSIQNSTNSGFGIQLSEDDIKNHLFLSDKVFLLKDKDRVIGFSSIKFFGDLIYRFGSVIHKDYQKKGIYTHLSNYVSGKQGFLRTQNQNVIKSLQKSGYRTLTGELAYDFMAQKIDNENINRFFAHLDNGINKFYRGIFRKVYEGPMGNKENVKFIDKNFHSDFEYKEGDALLVVYYK